MAFTVYGLVDPRTSLIRYVGRTERSAEVRRVEHVDKTSGGRVGEWLNELRDAGVEPIVVILEQGEGVGVEPEAKWIAIMRDAGTDITNTQVRGVPRPGVVTGRTRAAAALAEISRGQQSAVARRLDVGQSAISDLVRGNRIPRLGTILRIQKELGIPAEWWGEAAAADVHSVGHDS